MTQPMTLTLSSPEIWVIATLFAIAALSLLIFWATTPWQAKERSDAPWPMRLFMAFLIVLTPIWGLLIAATVVSLWNALLHSEPPKTPEAARWSVAIIGGQMTALIALVSAPLALIRVYTTERQTRTAEQGHMTDRISKAVEQLGAEKTVKIPGNDENGKDITLEATRPNIEVRIGGLLSLERISQDSVKYDKGRDHVRVMEILCAYVRENAPASGAVAVPPAPAKAEETNDRDHWKTYSNTLLYRAAKLDKPREDITTALNIIGRRDANQFRAEARWGKAAQPDADWVFSTSPPPYPKGKNGAEPAPSQRQTFYNDLEKWRESLRAYVGYRPDLRGTNLQKADLSGMILAGIRLEGAQLQGAVLREAQLQGAFLMEAQLQGAGLREAQLQGAVLMDAQLQGAVLWRAQLQGAVLWRAQLQGADISWAQLQGADISWAQLRGADLSWAQMDAATRLDAADVSQAALSSVDYSSVSLSPEQIKSMFGDGSVTLPGGATPDHADWPIHWPKLELHRSDFETKWRKWQANPETYTPP